MLKQVTQRVWCLPWEEERDRPSLYYIRGDRRSLAVDAGSSPAHVAQFYAALEKRGLPLPELKRLLACNDALAQEAYRNFRAMELDRGETPALFAYDGIQYKYMAPGLFTQEQLDYVKEHLRILSGFYGVLRPFDGVSPYRLEMQAKLKADFCRNLYEFWGDSFRARTGPVHHLCLCRGAGARGVPGKGGLCEDGPGRDGPVCRGERRKGPRGAAGFRQAGLPLCPQLIQRRNVCVHPEGGSHRPEKGGKAVRSINRE